MSTSSISKKHRQLGNYWFDVLRDACQFGNVIRLKIPEWQMRIMWEEAIANRDKAQRELDEEWETAKDGVFVFAGVLVEITSSFSRRVA